MPDMENMGNLPKAERNISSVQNNRLCILLLNKSLPQDKKTVGICLFMCRGLRLVTKWHDFTARMVHEELHSMDYKNQLEIRPPQQKVHLSSDNRRFPGRSKCLRWPLCGNNTTLSSLCVGKGNWVLFFLWFCIFLANFPSSLVFSLRFVFKVSQVSSTLLHFFYLPSSSTRPLLYFSQPPHLSSSTILFGPMILRRRSDLHHWLALLCRFVPSPISSFTHWHQLQHTSCVAQISKNLLGITRLLKQRDNSVTNLRTVASNSVMFKSLQHQNNNKDNAYYITKMSGNPQNRLRTIIDVCSARPTAL